MLCAVALPSSLTAFVFSGTNPSLCAENGLCKSEQGGEERRGALIVSTADGVFSPVPEKQNLIQLNLARVLEF